MNWTKEELSEQIMIHSTWYNVTPYIGSSQLAEIFANPKFPKEEEKAFLGLLNHMKELEKQAKTNEKNV